MEKWFDLVCFLGSSLYTLLKIIVFFHFGSKNKKHSVCFHFLCLVSYEKLSQAGEKIEAHDDDKEAQRSSSRERHKRKY